MKKVILLLSACFLAASLYSQQLTRVAVVDLPKVYSAFFRDSRIVREFEERSAAIQAEIDKMTREIQELRSKRVDLVQQGDQTGALRLENEIYRKQEFLKEYYTVKTAELEEQRRKLAQSDSFLEQVYGEIRSIAESEGYTMVWNPKDNPGIIWYSPTVDITDKVIQNLASRSRR
ncbi:MAG: OmpH family outer membrane protein [Treponema sp.]|jgi:outer membrane protein|nr:OmpH family outer membrane protein [Treponema sp.]